MNSFVHQPGAGPRRVAGPFVAQQADPHAGAPSGMTTPRSDPAAVPAARRCPLRRSGDCAHGCAAQGHGENAPPG